MATLERFEDIEAWKSARKLAVKIHTLSRSGAFAKDYAFRDQICRAAVSIVSNIAEGFERHSEKHFKQFLDIANGSASEVRAQLYLAFDFGYINDEQFHELLNDVIDIGKMINGFIRYLYKRINTAGQ